MDENTRVVALALISGVVAVATAYIAARWHAGRNHSDKTKK